MTPRAAEPAPARDLANLVGATKRYGAALALDGLDLAVREHELLAVLGPNGAGKSTAIAVLLGLQRLDSGQARLLGHPPSDVGARRSVGVMMQEVVLPPELKVRELVAMVAAYYPEPLSIAEALARAGVENIAERPYGKLSGGQKRQAQFAQAICGRPRLLFLDEPTTGLDQAARETMWATLRTLVGEGASIVLTTHYIEEAEALADRVIVLAGGRQIADGSVEEMRAIVSRKRIACVTAISLEAVAAWPEVEGVDLEGGQMSITTPMAESVVRRLLAADPALLNLEVRRAGLADAFVQLTQGQRP